MILLVLVVTARFAVAETEAVVVATDDPAFRTAIAEAFAPSGIGIVARDGVAAPALGAVASTSRALADDASATATVWLVGSADHATLVTYDRGVDRVLVRALPFATPLSPAQAAESARMARTMLRALRVTPETDLPPPHASEAAAIRASVPPPPASTAASWLATSLGVGTRLRGPGTTVALAAEGAVVWRPASLGAMLAGTYAPGASVRSAGLSAGLDDNSIALLARQPVRLGPRTEIAALAGAALHVVELRGTLPGGGSTGTTSFDPALRAGAAGLLRLDPAVQLGCEVSADYLLQRQDYLLDTREVLAVPRFQLAVVAVIVLGVL
jgi:hypothetical protein